MIFGRLDSRKSVFGGSRTTKWQTSLHICASFRLAYRKVSYLDLLQANLNILASLCSRVGWFVSNFVGNLEDRFSHLTANISLASCLIYLP